MQSSGVAPRGRPLPWLVTAVVAATLYAGSAARAADEVVLIQVSVHAGGSGGVAVAEPDPASDVTAKLRRELEGLLDHVGGVNASGARLEDLLGLVRSFRGKTQGKLCEPAQPEERHPTSLIGLRRDVTVPPIPGLGGTYAFSTLDWINKERVGAYVFVLGIVVCFVVLCVATQLILQPFRVLAWKKGSASNDSEGYRKVADVLIPFWTSARTYPVAQFATHFCFNIVFILCSAYWICFGILYAFGAGRPWLLEGAGIYANSDVMIAALAGVGFYPVLWLLMWPSLKQHKFQWWLWTSRMLMEVLNVAWVVESSAVMSHYVTALNKGIAAEYWNGKRLEFISFAFAITYWFILSIFRKLLQVEWRRFVTSDFLSKYFSHRHYYRLEVFKEKGNIWLDNPDQRICEDIGNLITAVTELLQTILLVLLRLLGFTRIVWNSSADMGMMSLGYAIFASVVVLFMMARLKSIKYRHQQAEANFRFALSHIRNNSESIAFYGGEKESTFRCAALFGSIVAVIYRYSLWASVCGVFDKSFDTLAVLLVPAMMAAPYFSGKMEMGAISMAEIAVSNTLGCASIIIIRVPLLLNFATDMNRITALYAKISGGGPKTEICRRAVQEERLDVSDLTVMGPNNVHICKDLRLRGGKLSHGPPQRVIIVGPSGVGKSSLLRVVSGLWTEGQGHVALPDDCMFLPQQPYMPIGSLRLQLTYPDTHSRATDDELRQLLGTMQLGSLPDRYEDGFEHECVWSQVLSLGEQQRLACLRLVLRKPRMAILDEATAALPRRQESHLYQLLVDRGIAYVSVGHRPTLFKHHDRVLQLRGEGAWRECSVEEYLATAESKKHA